MKTLPELSIIDRCMAEAVYWKMQYDDSNPDVGWGWSSARATTKHFIREMGAASDFMFDEAAIIEWVEMRRNKR